MSEHICPECGINRTDIIGMYCETCHEWADDLNMDYEEWREQFEEETPTGGWKDGKSALEVMGEANEKARNGDDGYTTH